MMPRGMQEAIAGLSTAYAKADRARAEQEKNDAEAARKKADIAEQQAKNKEIEAISVLNDIDQLTPELFEMQRVNELQCSAYLEACGMLDGISNITAVMNEDKFIQEQFFATYPLEQAIATNSLDAVKLLLSHGESYDKWSEIVDNNTPLYSLLSKDSTDVTGTVINLSNHDYNSLKLPTPTDAYLSAQTNIRQILGTSNTSYIELTDEQRIVVNNRLLAFTKQFYEAANKPAFLLYDFATLYDANVYLQGEHNPELVLALDKHIETYINHLAGYSTLHSTNPTQFMTWAENNAKQQACPIDKVLCTHFYELCEDSKLQAELTSRIIVDSALDAKDILQHFGNIDNGLRNAVLCDGGTLDFEYKSSLEKSCVKILNNFNEHDKFISLLNASDMGDSFAPFNQRVQKRQEKAARWDILQGEFLQALLKDAKREAILHKGCDLQQLRLDNFNNEFQPKYSKYTTLVDNYNQIVADYNEFAKSANESYQKSAQHQENSNRWLDSAGRHSSNYQAMSQNMAGTAPASNTVGFTVGASSKNGLTITQSHTIHKGNVVVAHASSTYNSRIAYGKKISATLAVAQARKNATEIPVACLRAFSDLSSFVNGNSQYLQDFEIPEFTLENPYNENRLIFANGVGNGLVGYSNFGASVVESKLFSDREESVHQLYSTPTLPATDSGNNHRAEPDNTFWNIAVNNLNQDWQPLAQKLSQDASLWNRFKRGVNNGMLTAITFITGSSIAEASPLVATGTFTGATAAAPGVSGYNYANPPPMTFKRLGAELLDVAQKSLLMTSVLINPAISREIMHQILVTPMHEVNPEESLLPGGYGTNIDTSIPPFEARDTDSDENNTGHSNSVPDIEEISIPPYSEYDGESLLFMYKDNNGKSIERKHAPDPDKKHHIPPRILRGFPEATEVNTKSLRKRWKMPDKTILEWDYRHGEIEMYSRNGKHLGTFDPDSGKKLKNSVPGRRIDP